MSRLDSETKRKLREMGVPALVDALDIQDEGLTMGLVFEERIKLAVDDAHAAFTHSKVEGLIRRAGLRYPNADLRRVDMLEQRGLDRGVIAQLGTCQFIQRHMNVVFQGFTGSGKSYLGSALAKQACQHRFGQLLGDCEPVDRGQPREQRRPRPTQILILPIRTPLRARRDHRLRAVPDRLELGKVCRGAIHHL